MVLTGAYSGTPVAASWGKAQTDPCRAAQNGADEVLKFEKSKNANIFTILAPAKCRGCKIVQCTTKKSNAFEILAKTGPN